MKKLLAILAIGAFTACGGGNNDPSNVDGGNGTSNTAAGQTPDSLKRATDSVAQMADTTALNSSRGDSSSASGSHGQGSGSRVGGGKTGGPQSKKGEKK